MSITVIKNGVLIDGKGKEPQKGMSVVIEGNKIKQVTALNDLVIPEDADIIDAEGKYILPGFIDTHVHMAMEMGGLEETILTPFSYRFYKSIHYMRRTLNAGITSVRDAGFSDLGMKKAVEDGLAAGPRMQLSINPLTITGGHGDNWNRSGVDTTLQTYTGMPDAICDGVEEVRKTVRKMLRAGAEVIKVHATGGVSSPTDHPEYTQFSQEELEVMVEEAAYRKGIRVMAHAQGAEGIKNAVRAGIHSIEHGIYIDDEAIELMRENDTFLVPTLLAPVSVLESAEGENSMASYAIEKSKEVIEVHKESIAKAHRAGVKIAMGTDAGVFAHGTNLRELGLLCDAGMTPMEVLTATTKTAAECLGWEKEVGTIEEGKLADVIMTDVDPLAEIHELEESERIVMVMKDGKIQKNLIR